MNEVTQENLEVAEKPVPEADNDTDGNSELVTKTAQEVIDSEESDGSWGHRRDGRTTAEVVA